MLSVHLVLEICGLKVVVSFNFAPSAPHVKRRVKSCEPRAAAATVLSVDESVDFPGHVRESVALLTDFRRDVLVHQGQCGVLEF